MARFAKKEFLLVLILTTLGAALRLYNLSGQGFWNDEMFTLLEANAQGDSFYSREFQENVMDLKVLRDYSIRPPSVQPVAVIRDVYRTEVAHTPLYFVIENLSIATFGISEFALRLPSVLFGAMTIPFLFLLGRRLHCADLGLVAAGLFAVVPYQVWYGQEARMYSMLIFLAVASTWLLADLSFRRKEGAHWEGWGFWIVYFLSITAGAYTHVFFVFIPVIHFLFLAVRHLRDRVFLMRWFIIVGISFLIFLPWPLARLFQDNTPPAGLVWLNGDWPILKLIRSSLNSFLEMILVPKVRPYKFKWVVTGLFILGLVAVGRKKTLWLLPLWVVIPAAGILFLDIVRATHASSVSRYVIVSSPALYLLVALGVTSIPQRLLSRILTGAILVYFAIGGYWTAEGKIRPRPEFRSAGQEITQKSKQNDLLMMVSSIPEEMAVTLAYYTERPEQILKVRVKDLKKIDWIPFAERLQSYKNVIMVVTNIDVGYPEDFDLKSVQSALPFLEFIEAKSYRGLYVIYYRNKQSTILSGVAMDWKDRL